MKTGTMTLDEGGACVLPMEILQEVGWQAGERLTVEILGGVIHVGRTDPLILDAQNAVGGRLDEGEQIT